MLFFLESFKDKNVNFISLSFHPAKENEVEGG